MNTPLLQRLNDAIDRPIRRQLLSQRLSKAFVFSSYADAEGSGEGKVFERALNRATDPKLQKMIRKHQDDELRHERLLEERREALGLPRLTIPPHLKMIDKLSEAAGGLWDLPMDNDGDVALMYQLSPTGRSWLGTGVGIVALDLWEGEPQTFGTEGEGTEPDPADPVGEEVGLYTWRTIELAYPHFAMVLRGPASRPWDFGVVVGARSNFFHLELDQGLPLPEKKEGVRWRIGADLAYTGSTFHPSLDSNRKVWVAEVRGGIELSRLLGEL